MAQKSSKAGAKKAAKSAVKKSAAPKKEKASKSSAKKTGSSAKAPAKKPASKAAKAPAKKPVKEKEPARTAEAHPAKAAKPEKKPEKKPEPVKKAEKPSPKPAAPATTSSEPAKDPFSEPPPASDEGRTVDDYIGRLSGWQAMVANMLRRSIKRAAPDATEAIKWSQPVYDENGPFAYFRVQGKQIQVGFWRGTDLFDEHKMLEGEGETMRHLWIRRPEDMKPQYIEALVRQAASLNRKPEEPTA
jgi:hypothetical protein